VDDPPADFLDHGRHIGIGGRLALDEARREARLSAIEVDALKEDAMEMEVEIDRTPETLDKCDRPWVDVGSCKASCDRLVHIILPDRGTDDRMDLRGEVLRGGHPIP
jgi:hypothetical protein